MDAEAQHLQNLRMLLDNPKGLACIKNTMMLQRFSKERPDSPYLEYEICRNDFQGVVYKGTRYEEVLLIVAIIQKIRRKKLKLGKLISLLYDWKPRDGDAT